MKSKPLQSKLLKVAFLQVIFTTPLIGNTWATSRSNPIPTGSLDRMTINATYTKKNVTVSGTVTDENHLPLPGVSIKVKGTNIGTSTDSNGKYTLVVPDNGAILIFSSIGFNTREVSFNGQKSLNVQLNSDAKNLNELVVVGYGTQKKKDVTGSVGSVSLTNVEKTPVFGTAQMLQGQVSGVQVTQTNSQPGAAFSVRVRGTNSINFSSDPLYVVDGYAGADITALNSNDIASIDVLKDASSTAIYGNRGANGVVIITTKSGTVGKNTISADVYSGFQQVGKVLKMMNATEFGTYLNRVTTYLNQNNTTQTPLPYTQAQLDALGEGTNYQKELFRTAPITNANVAMSGGSEGTKYLLSFNYFNQKGVILNSGYQRGTMRYNFNRAVSKKLNFGLNSQVSYDKQSLANVNTTGGSTGGTLLDALRINPAVPIFDPTGSFTFQNGPAGYANVLGNPIAAATLNINTITNLRLFANAFADYEFIPNLKLKVSVGTDDRFSNERTFRPTTTYLGKNTNGYSQIVNPQNLTWLNENTLSYNTVLDKIHSLSGVIGFTYQEFKFSSNTTTATALTTNNLGTDNLGVGGSVTATSTANKITLASLLARVNYSLLDKYLLTVSYRRDGTSTLGTKNQWGNFASGALAWRVSSEEFLKNIKEISDLKLRVGYGITGNSNIPAYSSLSQYVFNTYYLNGRVVGASPNNIGNPNLKWESTRAINGGVDLGLFANRLTFTADYYDKRTDKLLFNRTVPSSSGFTTVIDNIGSVSNKGFEFSITSQNIQSEKVKWSTSFNFSRNINKILSLGDVDFQYTGNVSSSLYPGGRNAAILQVGKPIGSFYGYVFDGIWQSAQEIAQSGITSAVKPGDPKYKDLNGDHLINDGDRTIIGQALPKFSYGLSSNLTVGKFNLFVLVQGVYGNQILNENKVEIENGTLSDNKLAYVLTDSWNGPGTSNTLPSVGSSYRRGLGPTSDILESGSYLRFKTITLTYELPLPKTSSIFKTASVYATGQNLFTITKYSGYDPEVNSYSNTAGNYTSLGTDYNPYPNIRTYTLGLRLGF
jgi:TonB-linked SusC/RagA family outer membrane protein